MFGRKKTTDTTPKPPTRDEQLGPRPADIPNTEELITFQVMLRHSLPSIEVRAHAHDFGQKCDPHTLGSGNFTHFIVRGDSGWVESHDYIDRDGCYRWRWVKERKISVVYSIRTDDVVMVAALDNTKASETETLALERREDPVGRPRPEYATGGWVKGPGSKGEINVSIDVD